MQQRQASRHVLPEFSQTNWRVAIACSWCGIHPFETHNDGSREPFRSNIFLVNGRYQKKKEFRGGRCDFRVPFLRSPWSPEMRSEQRECKGSVVFDILGTF
jgi:hypothetical protein